MTAVSYFTEITSTMYSKVNRWHIIAFITAPINEDKEQDENCYSGRNNCSELLYNIIVTSAKEILFIFITVCVIKF